MPCFVSRHSLGFSLHYSCPCIFHDPQWPHWFVGLTSTQLTHSPFFISSSRLSPGFTLPFLLNYRLNVQNDKSLQTYFSFLFMFLVATRLDLSRPTSSSLSTFLPLQTITLFILLYRVPKAVSLLSILSPSGLKSSLSEDPELG